MGSIGANQNINSAPANLTAEGKKKTLDAKQKEAKAVIAQFKDRAGSQTYTAIKPSDDHPIEINVQRTTQKTGRGTIHGYRIQMDDTVSGDRIWYTYRESLADAKDDMRRILGVGKGRARF